MGLEIRKTVIKYKYILLMPYFTNVPKYLLDKNDVRVKYLKHWQTAINLFPPSVKNKED